MNTVKWVLLSLCLEDYTHVVIKTRTKNGLMPVGGGSVTTVIKRYGDMHITGAMVMDNQLIIVVGL